MRKYHIDRHSGLISQADYHFSPNWNERPAGEEIDLVVIHSISLPPGEFGGKWIHAFFSNELDPTLHPYFKDIAHLKVSTHLYINRLGQLWQFVPFQKRAWHAGASVFQGKENCNDFSIGIELEGTDVCSYTPVQYQTLIGVTLSLLETYPKITLERIVGHSEIAPGRKTDPGLSFDWPYYRGHVVSLLEEKHTT